MICGVFLEQVRLPDNVIFDVTLNEAKEIQEHLRSRITLKDSVDVGDVRLIGGVDCAFLDSGIDADRPVEALAAAVTVDILTGEVRETVFARAPVHLPYIPGYLSFREGPAVIAALRELKRLPGVMIYDGCGIAHSRGCGLASHMGVLTGIPSIGCAKSKLCGTCDEPDREKGSWTDLVLRGEKVGYCVRSRTDVRPVFVSPGSGISIESSRRLVLAAAKKYRLNEPTRHAHNAVTQYKRDLMESL